LDHPADAGLATHHERLIRATPFTVLVRGASHRCPPRHDAPRPDGERIRTSAAPFG
jgi:hypothetical protein